MAYRDLAVAVVKQACSDYMSAQERCYRATLACETPKSADMHTVKTIAKWFREQNIWMESLRDYILPEKVLKHMNERAKMFSTMTKQEKSQWLKDERKRIKLKEKEAEEALLDGI